jgi:outer membrane protein OmpA-like peptidoglycan-associated protein/predicted small secreted protein
MLMRHLKDTLAIRYKLIAALPQAILIAGMVMLAGCNVSQGIAKDGSTAQKLVWPSPDDTIALHHGGTFPIRESLQAVHTGMDKRQIAALIGYPHFNEGVFGVREWNYLFNFHSGNPDQVTTCQFKILFDKDAIARSFYWNPEDCPRRLIPAREPVANAPVQAPRMIEQTTTFSADALFAFDRASLKDIVDDGKANLDRLASQLLTGLDHIEHVQVLGYTDRLGSETYNQVLSRKRAETVAKYLAMKGVPSSLIDAQGRGKDDSIAQCPNNEELNALIECLAPNRRAVVRVEKRGN